MFYTIFKIIKFLLIVDQADRALKRRTKVRDENSDD